MGSGAQSQPSPQSSPEVNVTCGLQPDIVSDQVVSSPPGLANSVEEEVDIPEPDEAEVTAALECPMIALYSFVLNLVWALLLMLLIYGTFFFSFFLLFFF